MLFKAQVQRNIRIFAELFKSEPPCEIVDMTANLTSDVWLILALRYIAETSATSDFDVKIRIAPRMKRRNVEDIRR